MNYTAFKKLFNIPFTELQKQVQLMLTEVSLYVELKFELKFAN